MQLGRSFARMLQALRQQFFALPRHFLIIGLIVLFAGIVGGTLLVSSGGAEQQTVLTASQQTATKKATLQSNASTQQTGGSASASGETTANSATPSTSSKTSTKPATTPAPSKATISFSLSADAAVVTAGGVSPTVTARTTDGKGVSWVIIAPGPNVFAKTGASTGAATTAAHSFSFGADTTSKPGKYTVIVRAWVQKGPTSDKTVTVTVLPRVTFSLSGYPGDGVNDLSDEAAANCTPFSIDWLITGPKPQLTMSASIISAPDPSMQVVGVFPQTDGGCIDLFGTITPGTLVIRLNGSDGTYSTSATLTYDIYEE